MCLAHGFLYLPLVGLVHLACSLPFGELAVVGAHHWHALALFGRIVNVRQPVKEDEVGVVAEVFLLHLVPRDHNLHGIGVVLYVEARRVSALADEADEGVQRRCVRLQVYEQLQRPAFGIGLPAVSLHHLSYGFQIHVLEQAVGGDILAVVRHMEDAVNQPDVGLDGCRPGFVRAPERPRLFIVVVRVDACLSGRSGQGACQQEYGQGNAENQCGCVHNSVIFYANLGIIRKLHLTRPLKKQREEVCSFFPPE